MPLSCLKLITRPFLQAPSLTVQPLRFVMDLTDLVSSLNDFASLSLAESWDNVGLLVEPSPPHTVNTLFLTNDLTEDVMKEALEKKADLILSYHPPIFRPLKRITWKTWKERLVIRALENRVGIYSPHTTYDAIPNGVNDWLAAGLGACTAVPLKPATASTYPVGGPFRVEFTVSSAESLETVLSQVHAMPEVSLIATQPARIEGEEQTRVSLNCSRLALLQVVALLSQKSLLYRTTEIISLEKPLLSDTGMGRLCTLHEPAPVSALIERLKSHLKLSHIRLALGAGKSLESSVKVVALCAGSGASILQDTESDLYVTDRQVLGMVLLNNCKQIVSMLKWSIPKDRSRCIVGEMSHHEVLDAVSRGVSVILCEHSNTERGFLLKLQQMLAVHFMNKVDIVVSERDRDPLQVA